MATNQSSGMKPLPLPIAICLKKNKCSCGFILRNVNFKNTNSVLQCTITTHFLAHQKDTHHSYFTSGENAAIHYGTNSTQGLGKATLLHLCMSYTSSGRHTQLKSGKTDQRMTIQKLTRIHH